jgi:SAM-dependent methyltransferase
MKVLNPAVLADMNARRGLRLDLGAGITPREGFYAVDKYEGPKTDIVADLSQPLVRLPDNSVSHIYSRHTLEHVENMLLLMSEIHRVCTPDAEVEIIVPHFSNVYGYSDPTHVRLFGIYSMFYFSPEEHQPKRKVPSYYTSAHFRVMSIEIGFYHYGLIDFLLVPLLSRWVNSSFGRQEFYERRLSSRFHAWQIRFFLSPIKTGAPYSNGNGHL